MSDPAHYTTGQLYAAYQKNVAAHMSRDLPPHAKPMCRCWAAVSPTNPHPRCLVSRLNFVRHHLERKRQQAQARRLYVRHSAIWKKIGELDSLLKKALVLLERQEAFDILSGDYRDDDF